VTLGVLAAPSVVRVGCEWSGADGTVEAALARVEQEAPTSAGQDGSHLAAAASRVSGGGVAWAVSAGSLGVGERARYRFVAETADGRRRTTRWYDVVAADWRDTGGELVVKGRDRVAPGSVSWLVDADGVRRVRFALPLAEGEHVVGFGERFDRLDQRGHVLDAVVFEQYKGQGQAGRTYLPMPFAIVAGGEGWGFHVETSRRTCYDVGASDAGLIWVEAELGGGVDETLTLRLYDGLPPDVLRAFLDEVGRPQPMPSWVFRLWASGNEWNTQARVMAELDRHQSEDVPVGVVVIEAWSDESTFVAFRDATYDVHDDGAPHSLAEFTFPSDGAWPDPKGMVDELHGRDVRVVLWQIPLQKMRPHPKGQAAADARAMVANDYCVREADGQRPYRNRGWWFPLALMPDLSSDAARKWWLSKRRYLVEEVGIDGFKTDGGEHAWGADLRYADGRRGDSGNNLFPVHYASAYGELLKSCGKPPVTFSRAGFVGSQSHGCFWAGDEDSTWEAFRSSVLAGVSASASGIVYWGWDLAGFSGEVPDAELYLRAAAMACFAPIMQYHSEYNHHRLPRRDRTPWNIAERSGDSRVLPTFRRFAQLRERLAPYLAEQVDAGLRSGRPLMRAMMFDVDADPRIWDFPEQYFLGDSLLVAPVTSPGVEAWSAYLPAGDWVDVWTGQPVGPGEVTRPVPIDEIPVWCRAEAWPRLAGVFVDLAGAKSP
jgi:alpha-glucosidase (family GH31 glycosyl hydrolase)